MRSAPTLKIWMTPLASVAMLEKLALLKIAFCKGPGFKQGLLAPNLGNALRRASGGVENGGIADFFGHGRPLLKRELVWRIARPKVRATPHLLTYTLICSTLHTTR